MDKQDKNMFIENIELDAGIVLSGMRGGVDAIMNFGYMHRAEFTNTNMVMDRCEWLKKQSLEYIRKVSLRAAELEKNK